MLNIPRGQSDEVCVFLTRAALRGYKKTFTAAAGKGRSKGERKRGVGGVEGVCNFARIIR